MELRERSLRVLVTCCSPRSGSRQICPAPRGFGGADAKLSVCGGTEQVWGCCQDTFPRLSPFVSLGANVVTSPPELALEGVGRSRPVERQHESRARGPRPARAAGRFAESRRVLIPAGLSLCGCDNS